jgi:hypothetical protein
MAPPPRDFVGAADASVAEVLAEVLAMVEKVEDAVVDDVEEIVGFPTMTLSDSLQSTTNAGANTIVTKGYRKVIGVYSTVVSVTPDIARTSEVASIAMDTVAPFWQGCKTLNVPFSAGSRVKLLPHMSVGTPISTWKPYEGQHVARVFGIFEPPATPVATVRPTRWNPLGQIPGKNQVAFCRG